MSRETSAMFGPDPVAPLDPRGRRLRLGLLAALLAAALLARVGYGLYAHGKGAWRENIDEYAPLALHLATEGRYVVNDPDVPSIEREPGFPIVLAFGYALAGPGFATTLAVLCLFNLGTIVLVWAIAWTNLGRRAAWAAAVLAAFYPYYVYYSVHPYREAVFGFFCVLCVWLWLRWLRAPTAWGLAWAGLANGWTCLVSFTHFPFAVLSALAAVGLLRQERRWARLALYFACFAAAYGPWPARTYIYYREVILSTPYAPFNLYVSMLIPPELKGLPAEGEIAAKDAVLARFDKLRHRHPEEAYRLMVREGLKQVRERPGVYAKRVLKHFIKLWRLYPYPREYGHSYRYLKWVSLLSEGFLIPMGLAGLWLCRANKEMFTLVAIHIFSLTLIHSLSFAVIRHRLPLMAWMILFTGCLLGAAAGRLTRAKG
ncbi:MAG: glycosyltransferase family 39 protein [Elusimicrobiota bacterium]